MVSPAERARLIGERCPGDAAQGDCIAYVDQCIAQEDEGRAQFELVPAKGDIAFVYGTLAECAAAGQSLARIFGPPRPMAPLRVSGGGPIPPALARLHESLAAEELQGEDLPRAMQEEAFFQVSFYGSWFPEEVKRQFELAHQALARAGRKPGHALMALERIYAPNPERFIAWISRRQGEWNAQVGSEASLLNNVGVAQMWTEGLSPEQRRTVEALFSRADEVLKARGYDLGGEYVPLKKTMLEITVLLLAGRKGDPKMPEEVLTDAFFTRDPAEVLRELKEEHHFDYQVLPPLLAARVWKFFVDSHAALCTSSDYWSAMEHFLLKNTQFVGEFLDRREAWFAGVPKDHDSSAKQAGHYHIHSIFEALLKKDLVPKGKRREIHLGLMRFRDEGFDVAAYEGIADVDAMEGRMIRDFLTKEGREADGYASSMIDEVCERLLVARAKAWGSRRMIAFLRKHLPRDVVRRLKVSFDLIGFMVDQEPAAVASFLRQYQDPSRIPDRDVEDDPLWKLIWNAFDGGVLSAIFENASDLTRYGRAIKRVPEMLIGYGKRDIVRRFYFENHPYAPIYRLPADLRPTGEELSFVSIDSFYDPAVKRHSDKSGVRAVDIEKPHWGSADSPSHGVGTSSMAVGETMGLAPDAALYVSPVDASVTQNLPMTVLESLLRIIELKKRDPSVAVVGISLGLEVRTTHRHEVAASSIFRQMVACCEELHRMGVAIVVSAGNDGKKDLINMLGLLPHVTLVGAVDSKRTAKREDDAVSAYSTGGDAVNRPDLAAHADPVLFPVNGDKALWLETGGTSSAQPHFSGTLLLMKSVNPALSMDECLLILKQTADVLQGDTDVKGIDPMEALVAAAHLPGSTYAGKRLERFSTALGYDSERFRRSEAFREIQRNL